MSMKSINDTMGPNELVRSLLLYGVLHDFPGPSKTNTKQKESFEALRLARA